MDKAEMAKVLSILKVAYPNYYRGISKDEALAVVNLWTLQLSDIPMDAVMIAVQKHIASSKWPPTIAEIRDRIGMIYAEAVTDYISGDHGTDVQAHLVHLMKTCKPCNSEPELLRLIRNGGWDRVESQSQLTGSLPDV